MSFQPVLSACVLKDLGASLYIDTEFVLRSAGAVVPAGLAGLTDCVELRSSNGVDFAVRRRDGSVMWCYRATSTTYLYREFKPGDVIDDVVMGVVEEAETADLAEFGAVGSSLTLRDKNGRVFWAITDRSTAPRLYAHERSAASGSLIRGVSVAAGAYVGSDGVLVYLFEQSVNGKLIAAGASQGGGYQSVSGAVHHASGWARRMAITSSGAISLQMQYGDNPTDATNAVGYTPPEMPYWVGTSYTALVVRGYGVGRSVPGAPYVFSARDTYNVAGAILQSGGKRYVASFWRLAAMAGASILSYVIEAPTAVALWEYGYITADGAVFWNTPKGGNYAAAGVPFFGPLTTNWSDRSQMYLSANETPGLTGQASVEASLFNKVDDLVCYFHGGVAAFDVVLQSMLTVSANLAGTAGLSVRWDPEFGNIVQIDAAFAATGALSASFTVVATAPTAASFSGVAGCVVVLQVERDVAAAFQAACQVSAVLSDSSVLRDGVTLPVVAGFSARISVGRVYPDGVVKLLRKVVAGGLSVEPDNEVTLRGARYVNARWTREGRIPLGLNWGSSPEGLRFWGTPQESGEMSAIFEGPYPDGFQSNRTDAGQQSGGAVGCASLDAAGSFLVDRYEVKFLVEEVPLVSDGNGGVGVSDFTLGEVVAELLGNPSAAQAAWRGAWGSAGVQRGLSARGGTASIASSSLAPSPTGVKMPLFYRGAGGLVQAGDLVPEDMAASDWRFGSSVIVARGGRGVLRTAGAQVQALAAETGFSYADYVGEALDGVRRACAFQAEIPLLPGVCWGEFYLRSGFAGQVQVLFYTTDQGAVTDHLAAQLGLKFFYRVQESTAATYRSARTGLAYDFLSGSEQICRATLPLEGRHGVYRLQVPQDVAPGTMANLSIIVKGDV